MRNFRKIILLDFLITIRKLLVGERKRMNWSVALRPFGVSSFFHQ